MPTSVRRPVYARFVRSMEENMNHQSRKRMQFVLYSTKELFSTGGDGFWSNTEGWVAFSSATRFILANVHTCNIPAPAAADALWMLWEPAPTLQRDRATSRPPR